MTFQSINPATGDLQAEYGLFNDEILEIKLRKSHRFFLNWRRTDFQERSRLISRVGEILLENKLKYGRIITLEMGKPIGQAIAEIEKCAWLCRFYAENAADFLKAEHIKTDYSESFVEYDPLGTIYAIMPWNYPFWQLFRCAVPAIMAGNTVVLKHAQNVPQCALFIEEVFKLAEAPTDLFYNLFIDHSQSETVVSSRAVQGISLTGSEKAGGIVASQAGKSIKHTVLELGGSDPFIVLDDANIEEAVKMGVKARMQNAGQSCIAAKRFIINEKVADVFIQKYVEQVNNLKIGNPLLEDTDVGPMARNDLRETLAKQIEDTIKEGGRLLTGGEMMPGKGFYFKPGVLIDIAPASAAYKEELFGPVAAMYVVKTDEEAVLLANDTSFGLGASIWTKNVEHAKELAKYIDSGSVYINTIVKSNPHLPFGGVKKSGYGRELSKDGIMEFVNKKTIAIA